MLQHDITVDRLADLQRAVSGDPVIVVDETRTAFGYVGDMGNLPATLTDLWIKDTQPAFTFDTTKKTGAGWNGPYVTLETIEALAALMKDGWGNGLSYSNSPFTDATFGAGAKGKLASLGPDFSLGNGDDITVNFFNSEVVSRVQGFVRDNKGNVVPGMDITLNYAQNGVLTSSTATTDSLGYYFFADIPFGNRSLTVEPRLVLAAGTAVVKGGNNDDVEFFVKNFASEDITITSMTFDYSIDPPAYFNRLRVDGSTVYNSSNPRLGTGDTVNFSGKNGEGARHGRRVAPDPTSIADNGRGGHPDRQDRKRKLHEDPDAEFRRHADRRGDRRRHVRRDLRNHFQRRLDDRRRTGGAVRR